MRKGGVSGKCCSCKTAMMCTQSEWVGGRHMYNYFQHFIFLFLTGRRQAVHSGGRMSDWLSVTRSIIQGSGIGPSLYLV